MDHNPSEQWNRKEIPEERKKDRQREERRRGGRIKGIT